MYVVFFFDGFDRSQSSSGGPSVNASPAFVSAGITTTTTDDEIMPISSSHLHHSLPLLIGEPGTHKYIQRVKCIEYIWIKVFRMEFQGL